MSRDIFLQVRDAIEAEPDRYDQSRYRWDKPNCGTAFCIAGWMVELDQDFEHDTDSNLYAIHIQSGVPSHYIAAGVIIGDLSAVDAEVLFAEAWRPKPELSLSQALTMLAEGHSVEDVTEEFCYKCLLEDSSWRVA